MKKQSLIIVIIAAIIVIGGAFFITNQNKLQDTAQDQKKIGFIYIGPPGDHGWTYMHDQGRQYMEKELGDAISTTYIENVPENADAVRSIRKLADSGHDLIFTTSFNYMDQTLEVAKEFPDVKFEHATGFQRTDNVSTYSARFYEGRTVIGHLAGKMTETNTIGYIVSFPIPEVIRGINAFYLAASKVNPDVKIKIIWVYSWYDPGKEADAAKVHIAEGADILAQHTDSPAMLQIAEKNGALGFGQSTNMGAFAPKAQLFASVNNWGPYYIKKIKLLKSGKWNTGDGPDHWAGNTWGGLSTNMLTLSNFSNMPTDVAKKAQAAHDGIKSGKLKIFAGPLKTNDGKKIIDSGKTLDDGALWGMNYYLEGVTGKVPK